MPDATPPPGVDTTRPSPARLYDYALGGTDNYQVDRAAAAAALAVAPGLRDVAAYNRAWLRRVVRYLTDQGVRQFIDIGSGLPTVENVHEVAQRHQPTARVVYVDNDPSVHVHARALLDDTGRTGFVLADVRDPEAIMGADEVDRLIDLSQPVGLIMAAILHFVSDADDPAGKAAWLARRLCPGGYVAVSHATTEGASSEVLATVEAVYRRASEREYMRPRSGIEQIVDALVHATGGTVIEPGLVPVQDWRPDGHVPVPPLTFLGAVLRVGD